MFVNIDGHVVELETAEDVALFVACLKPTPEQVEAAKAACDAERRAAEQIAHAVIDRDGHITEAA